MDGCHGVGPHGLRSVGERGPIIGAVGDGGESARVGEISFTTVFDDPIVAQRHGVADVGVTDNEGVALENGVGVRPAVRAFSDGEAFDGAAVACGEGKCLLLEAHSRFSGFKPDTLNHRTAGDGFVSNERLGRFAEASGEGREVFGGDVAGEVEGGDERGF